jgi:ribosome-associated protein
MAHLKITADIAIDERELEERFVRSSGPGGQNVNKVSTAVELRFDLGGSPSLPEGMRARAMRLAGRRLTEDGILIIQADRFRTQERNRADARERLVELLARAAIVPKRRIPTRPTRAAKERRHEAKSKRSRVKGMRRTRPDLD